MVHAHVTTWFVAIILFFVGVYLQKSGKDKPLKIVQMILRLFYILILATGLHLMGVWGFTGAAIIKGLIGLWVIFSMEFILTRAKKEMPTKIFWIQFVIGFILALYFGYGVIG